MRELAELMARSGEAELRSLAKKYGFALIVAILNQLVGALIGLSLLYSLAYIILGTSDVTDPATNTGYLVSMLVNTLVSYTLPIIFFRVMFREETENHGVPPFAGDGSRRYVGETMVLYICGSSMAGLGSLFTQYVSELFNWLMNIPEPELAFSGRMPLDLFQYAVFAASSIIVAPLCEEYIYRCLLLRPLRKYGDLTAAVTTALIFGLTHFNFSQFLYTFALGFFLAIIAIRSDSVVPAILCHVINNMIAVVQTYMPESLGNELLDGFAAQAVYWADLLGLLFFYAGLPAVLIAAVLKLFRLNSPSGIPAGRQLRLVFTQPVFVIGVLLALALATALLWT